MTFSRIPKSRILVCGGDGTVSWILSSLETLHLSRSPPIAILPLGTGNDLARVHGWGGGYVGESLLEILKDVRDSYTTMLDRWDLTIETDSGTKKVKTFNNYFGIGADAQAALDFHRLRENKPELFFSRMTNKVWYAVLGAEDIFKNSCIDIPRRMTLICDGVEVAIPDDCQGLVFLNIDSYAGGINLWSGGQYPEQIEEEEESWRARNSSVESLHNFGRRKRLESMDDADAPDPHFIPDSQLLESILQRRAADSSCQDGMLDIVSIKGCLHLGQINVGLSQAEKIAQAEKIEIWVDRKFPCQLDGEPWGQGKCKFTVSKKKDQGIMLHKADSKAGGVASEMINVLDWAEERGIIKKSQHDAMTKEFSRRIEARGIKSVSSKDNLVQLGVKSMGKIGAGMRKNISSLGLGLGSTAREEEHFLTYEFSADEKVNFEKEDCTVM
ncbi:hypothetical protein TrVE_jg737 [Triparma verrucosa]|nr:hypothetical protein TrVE_jg737 [Triparma verrucosa]GMI01160.1 hypothetical protein TrST_g822 [Triparma strigata]